MLIFIKKLRAARIEPPALSRIFVYQPIFFFALRFLDDLAQNDDRDRYQHGDGYDYRQPADEPHDEIADTCFKLLQFSARAFLISPLSEVSSSVTRSTS